MEINNIIGNEIIKKRNVFQGGYSLMSFFEIRERKNKNIKNTKNGKNIRTPILETITFGN